MVIVRFNGFEVIQLFSEGGWGGGLPPGGLNRVKARLSAKPLNSRARGGGGYFRNFWVGMCRWDPGTLNLY